MGNWNWNCSVMAGEYRIGRIGKRKRGRRVGWLFCVRVYFGGLPVRLCDRSVTFPGGWKDQAGMITFDSSNKKRSSPFTRPCERPR